MRHLARPDTWAPDDRWWSEDDVVGAVVDRIEARPHLMMRRKSVEAMAMEIRARLQSMMDAHMAEYADDVPFGKHQEPLDWKHERKTPHLRAADFESFLESDAFQTMLDGYVDPIQKQIDQMKPDSV